MRRFQINIHVLWYQAVRECVRVDVNGLSESCNQYSSSGRPFLPSREYVLNAKDAWHMAAAARPHRHPDSGPPPFT